MNKYQWFYLHEGQAQTVHMSASQRRTYSTFRSLEPHTLSLLTAIILRPVQQTPSLPLPVWEVAPPLAHSCWAIGVSMVSKVGPVLDHGVGQLQFILGVVEPSQ